MHRFSQARVRVLVTFQSVLLVSTKIITLNPYSGKCTDNKWSYVVLNPVAKRQKN